MRRQYRRGLVLQTLREVPEARSDQRRLLVEVWRAEGAETLDDVLALKCSQPEGVLRDRRRVEILKEFPRDEKKYQAYRSYLEEFGRSPRFHRNRTKARALPPQVRGTTERLDTPPQKPEQITLEEYLR